MNNVDIIQSEKCAQFIKSRGRRHKLCIGQSRKLRRRRILKSLQIDNNENRSEINNFDPEMDIFELEETLPVINDGNVQDSYYDNQMRIFPDEENDSQIDPMSIFPSEGDKIQSPNYSNSEKVFLSHSRITQCGIIDGLISKRKKGDHSKCTNFNTTNEQEKESIGQNLTADEKKINKIVDNLMNRELLTKLVKNLDEHNLTKDFIFSVKSMAEGSLPVDSVPHLAHLETVRFHHVADSRRMWYSQKMKKFWHCFYKVEGGPPLRLLSGPKGTGYQNYEPSNCLINFAVPSANTIRCLDSSTYAKFIPPSIFNQVIQKIGQSIEMKSKEFILSYDGKSVGTGLKGDNYGDVDLWGFEYEPNLKLAKERLEKENEAITKFGNNFHDGNYCECQKSIEELFGIITYRIKDIRKIIDKCKKNGIKI